MSTELSLIFPNSKQIFLQSHDKRTQLCVFENPLTRNNLKDIRWYLEVYACKYTTEVDDNRARFIEEKLIEWGNALFNATLNHFKFQPTFVQFFEQKQSVRTLTIKASHPEILGLPWELLHIPGSSFLFNNSPCISIRRQLNVNSNVARTRFQVKEKLHLLFIVSRPKNTGFINPRGDSQAVLNALEQDSQCRIEVEFLRPATLEALKSRLDNPRLPEVDIIHFDGHGVYDADGRWFAEANQGPFFGLVESDLSASTGIGYLLFENEIGNRMLVSAEKLANLLRSKKVGLIVLSACQSASMSVPTESSNSKETEEESVVDTIGSVAARLTYSGIPAVLAMTYSVLVNTTEMLFGQFYRNLGEGLRIGEALDTTRHFLYQNTARGFRSRGFQNEVSWHIQDWFLPALYQAKIDIPLLTPESKQKVRTREVSEISLSDGTFGNLPALRETGFWGRSRELWLIENAYAKGIRRITITGFEGQGKTSLAVEAGRWLYKTRMFERVCFVDYSAYQGQDPVGYAVITLSRVLGKSLINASVVVEQLQQTPTLIVLDNLETLETQSLPILLEVAKAWSEIENSRLLLTTRQPNFHNPGYEIKNSYQHIRLQLKGLGNKDYPDDALDYFEALQFSPPASAFPKPERKALVKLFALVDFHPLSIGLLSRQLKERQIKDVCQELEQIFLDPSVGNSEIANPLIASLNLSLDRVNHSAKILLLRLGIFQGGAFENDLLLIIGLEQGNTYEKNIWSALRRDLVITGLIQIEFIPNVEIPYLKFHPTLAPLLWSKLNAEEQDILKSRHCQKYQRLLQNLFFDDYKNPQVTRAIVHRDLPNLIYAVNQLIKNKDENAKSFVDYLCRFLGGLGFKKEQEELMQRLETIYQDTEVNTSLSALSNRGDIAMSYGRYNEAITAYQKALQKLGNVPSLNKVLTLLKIGRCHKFRGEPSPALEHYQKGLLVIEQLKKEDHVMQEKGLICADIADILRDHQEYTKALTYYQKSREIFEALGNFRGIFVAQLQTASLMLMQGNVQEAQIQYQEALHTSQDLEEPESEAVARHQLGLLYQKLEQWDDAEKYYREAAQIKEKMGLIGGENGAITTWFELARMNLNADRIDAAIPWYEKVLSAIDGDFPPLAKAFILNDLSDCLRRRHSALSPIDLVTARQYAEEALAIKATLNSAPTRIWDTYELLARISETEGGKKEQVREYRQLARQTKAALAGTREEYLQYREFIDTVVVATRGDSEIRRQAESEMQKFPPHFSDLVIAIRRIFDGCRDEAFLVDILNWRDSIVISLILQGVANPKSLQDLLNTDK